MTLRKIYLASSWRNERQPFIVETLRAEGHEVYDFRNPTEGDHGFSWKHICPDPPPWSAQVTREVLQHPVADHGFGLDKGALEWCDTLVMLQPCGRSAALELGYACGKGKRTIVLLEDFQEPELMLKMADHLCVTIEEVLEALL